MGGAGARQPRRCAQMGQRRCTQKNAACLSDTLLCVCVCAVFMFCPLCTCMRLVKMLLDCPTSASILACCDLPPGPAWRRSSPLLDAASGARYHLLFLQDLFPNLYSHPHPSQLPCNPATMARLPPILLLAAMAGVLVRAQVPGIPNLPILNDREPRCGTSFPRGLPRCLRPPSAP